MEESLNQEKCPSKWVSRRQNSEIKVRGKAGVPQRSHSDAQVSKLQFFYGKESWSALCKSGFKVEENLFFEVWVLMVNEKHDGE